MALGSPPRETKAIGLRNRIDRRRTKKKPSTTDTDQKADSSNVANERGSQKAKKKRATVQLIAPTVQAAAAAGLLSMNPGNKNAGNAPNPSEKQAKMSDVNTSKVAEETNKQSDGAVPDEPVFNRPEVEKPASKKARVETANSSEEESDQKRKSNSKGKNVQFETATKGPSKQGVKRKAAEPDSDSELEEMEVDAPGGNEANEVKKMYPNGDAPKPGEGKSLERLAFEGGISVARASRAFSRPEQDPEHPNWKDPLPPNICKMCYNPHQKGLIRCNGGTWPVDKCFRYFHTECVGLGDVNPTIDGYWICKDCTNGQLERIGLSHPVGVEGTAFPYGDDWPDEDEDQSQAHTPDEDEDQSQEQEDETFEEGDSEKEDETYVQQEESEEDFEDDSSHKEAGVQTPSSKKPSPRKGKTSSKKKKWKKRAAGEPPMSAKQQHDVNVRVRLDAVQGPMENLQLMSIPFTRTDEYNPDDPAHEEYDAEDEERWPWHVHGMFCMTTLKPNEDGSQHARHFRKPQLHLWLGSEALKEWAMEAFLNPMNITYHTNYNSYQEAFRSQSAMDKEPPKQSPRQKSKKKGRKKSRRCLRIKTVGGC